MNRYIKNVCTHIYMSAYTHRVKLPNKVALERKHFATQLPNKTKTFFPKDLHSSQTNIPIQHLSYQYPTWSFVGTNQSLFFINYSVRIQHVY